MKQPPRLIELPTDRSRSASPAFQCSTELFELNPNLTQEIRIFSQTSEVTLFITLLAAIASLLYRYTGQEDILVCSLVERDRQSKNKLQNTLVLHTDLSGNPTFEELLKRVKQMTLETDDHKDLPFENRVKELQPEADFSQNPLVQVGLVLLKEPRGIGQLEGVLSSESTLDFENVKLDLKVYLWADSDRLKGEVLYDSSLFNAATITRLVEHYQVLLAGIVANPQQTISHLSLLTETERHQLLVEWNNTQTDYPQDSCIHEQFEVQSLKTPDAVAVVFEEQQLTYQELNCRANQLAHHLQKLGVKSEVLVGICVERSLEMVVGILGILKAGGAYLSLDPTYPSERLTLMLEDTQAPVLLTQQHLIKALPQHNAKVVCLDVDWTTIARESEENLGKTATADNLVYVTYTSGSTGKPKGIAMTERPLLNLLEWQLGHYELTEGMRTLQLASLSFDVSFQEMFSTWLSGGVLVMIPEALRRDAVGLSRFIANNAINRVFIPAPALHQLAEGFFVHEQFPTQLRYVIAGSEQLQITQAIANLFTQLKTCTLHNEYGPSETHVVTIFDLPQSPSNWPVRPPIGRPIANTQIYLLDSHLQPVPVGVIGEVYIGGAGLARCYLNRPDLTDERFIPNPFKDFGAGDSDEISEDSETAKFREKSNNPKSNIQHPKLSRLYKTGDLARYLPDGTVEYLGRIDHQVKIRGFRIELGEIEAVLTQHPNVRETVVIAREDVPGDKRLVAYVVLARKDASALSDVRQFLKQKLPHYMMPAAFVMLDALPLTPNRKVDRKALPVPNQIRPDMEEPFVAPRTAIEQQLANIWQQVLGLERVGIHDNFLDLGGHSLLATQIISRIREAFRIEVPLDTLLEEPTVAKQAERIETLRWIAQNQQASSANLESDREEGEL
ncbi:MAG TPA: amino acid adenylation domain-containing protein [Waterburya sp.]|jgi:amino acid adenylation domain-containing protein